jgi:hypothetical protein
MKNPKLLILGNCHMGAVGRAINSFSRPLSIHMLTAPGRGLLPKLKIEEGCCLSSDDPEISRKLKDRSIEPITNYSHIIIGGCQLRTKGRGKDWFKHIEDDSRTYSSGFRKALMDDFIINNDHYRFVKSNSDLIQNLKKTRVVSMPCPMPSEIHPSYLPEKLSVEKARATEVMMRGAFTKLGVDFLNTPQELVNNHGTATKNEYGKDSCKDFIHLNNAGGLLLLEEIISHVGL